MPNRNFCSGLESVNLPKSLILARAKCALLTSSGTRLIPLRVSSELPQKLINGNIKFPPESGPKPSDTLHFETIITFGLVWNSSLVSNHEFRVPPKVAFGPRQIRSQSWLWPCGHRAKVPFHGLKNLLELGLRRRTRVKKLAESENKRKEKRARIRHHRVWEPPLDPSRGKVDDITVAVAQILSKSAFCQEQEISTNEQTAVMDDCSWP